MKNYQELLDYASSLETLPLYYYPYPSINVLGLNYDIDIILYQIPKEVLSIVPVVETGNNLFLVFFYKDRPFALYGKGKNPDFQSVKVFCQESWSESRQYLLDLIFKDNGHEVVYPKSYIEKDPDGHYLWQFLPEDLHPELEKVTLEHEGYTYEAQGYTNFLAMEELSRNFLGNLNISHHFS